MRPFEQMIEIYWCLGEVFPHGENLTSSELGWLSLTEKEIFERMRFPKRRKEWLSGRWVSKHLLKYQLTALKDIPLSSLSIENEEDGSPVVKVNDQRLIGCLSLSHRGDKVAAAWSGEGNISVGIDAEWIEDRHPAFLNDYFTDREIEWVLSGIEEERARRTTMLWSAKEAGLKALKLGLSVDSRRIEVLPAGQIQQGEWQDLDYYGDLPATGYHLKGWSQQRGNYLISLAVYFPAKPRIAFTLHEINISA